MSVDATLLLRSLAQEIELGDARHKGPPPLAGESVLPLPVCPSFVVSHRPIARCRCDDAVSTASPTAATAADGLPCPTHQQIISSSKNSRSSGSRHHMCHPMLTSHPKTCEAFMQLRPTIPALLKPRSSRSRSALTTTLDWPLCKILACPSPHAHFNHP
jgi:hypothetical protein